MGIASPLLSCAARPLTGSAQVRPLARRRFFGLRSAPGRLALWVFRLPLALYRHGWGWMLGRTFLMFVHVGRTTGRPHEAVAMVLGDDPATQGLVICSACGPGADGIRNLHAAPAAEILVGRDRFLAASRFLADGEAVAVGNSFRQRDRYRLRLTGTILGWGDLGSDGTMRRFVRTHPFVAFWPADVARAGADGLGADPVVTPPGGSNRLLVSANGPRADRIVPELQHIAVDDRILDGRRR